MTIPPFAPTISPEAAEIFKAFPDTTAEPTGPGPDDFDAWTKVQEERDARFSAIAPTIAEQFNVAREQEDMGGVPCYRVAPKDGPTSDRTFLHVHGGGYTLFSLETASIGASVLAAHESATVYSVGYTLAPHARAPQIRAQVCAAASAVRAHIDPHRKLVGVGDSAGGALVTAAALDMQENSRQVFDALVLMSPWSDISENGDTYITLKQVEPTYIYEQHLKPAALAYCPDESQWKDPFISPVYGNYDETFPPTLIQGGTRETFLSNCVRHYQAIKQSGGHAELDLYEGMTHVFQVLLSIYGAPEAKAAFNAITGFLNRTCDQTKRDND